MLEYNVTAQYWAFLTFFFAALSICLITLFFSWILGGRSNSRYKHTPFESGIEPTNNTDVYCSVKFYLVAICFVLFDIEALYLYVWSISILECGWIGFIEIVIFVVFLLSGLIYLISSGTLHWGPED